MSSCPDLTIGSVNCACSIESRFLSCGIVGVSAATESDGSECVVV